MTTEVRGLLVDPLDGVSHGVLHIGGGRIVAVDPAPDAEPGAPLVFPGFVDLHIYDHAHCIEQGVTGYLATVGTAERGRVEEFLAALPDAEACLGAHVEGPYLNPKAAGAQPEAHIRPVDLEELDGWLATGQVRAVTLAPELDDAFDAIDRIVAAGALASIGHTAANHRTTWLAIERGARLATHLWNAMGAVRARAPGPITALIEDERVTVGLNADGRHVHPSIEALTVRACGTSRVALTSDRVVPPHEREDGSLLGGDRCGAALVRRIAPRFGLAETAAMASLTPASALGLADRGRLAPGYRADLAVLGPDYSPRATIVAGRTAWEA